MISLNDIIESIKENKIRVTDHADEEATNDKLKLDEILFSVIYGEIIEDYSSDKPFPSCLILGFNEVSDPIHSVWAYNKENQWAVLITVYRPDPDLWIDWRIRRKKS